MSYGRAGVICLLAASGSLPALSYGQNAVSAEANPSDTTPIRTLDEVVITATSSSDVSESTKSYTVDESSTATRLPLTLRETPQSVTVITDQLIEDLQLNSMQDVLETVTGITSYTQDTSRSTFYSRGFSINSYMYDGIPTTYTTGGSKFLDTTFYDRVEVVRGATGLVSGSGNPSAAVNLVRKRPKNEFDAALSLSAGSHGSYRGVADISSPLNKSGSVRGRLVTLYDDNKSFMDGYKEEKKGLYAIIEADLTRDTFFSIGYDYQKPDPKRSTWNGIPLFYSDGSRTDYSRSRNPSADWAHWGTTASNAFAKLEHTFDNGWLARGHFNHGKEETDAALYTPSLAGYPDKETGGFAANDLPYSQFSYGKNHTNSFDLTVSGPFSLLGRRHDAVIGASYSHRNTSNRASGRVDGQDGAAGDYDSLFGGKYPKPDYTLGNASGTEVTQIGVYAAGRFSLTDKLNLILGGRFSNYEANAFTSSGVWSNTYKYSPEFTPYGGLIYQLNNTYSVYLSHARIFQPSAGRYDVNGNLLDPTTGKTTEAGLKASYLDGRLNAALSIFKNDVDQAVADTNRTAPDGSQAYIFEKGTNSKGFDIDVQGEVMPNWKIYAGFSRTLAKGSNGTRLQSTIPNNTSRISTTYRINDGAFSGLTIGGGINWQSDIYSTVRSPTDGSVRINQSSYALVSLMARYEITQKSDVSLNVSNLFDKKKYRMLGFYNRYLYGNPREFTVTYKHRF